MSNLQKVETGQYLAESGHWYDSEGNPKYTIKGANGKIRPTTLRDAKKHGFYPSVTTILNTLDKPGLTRWMNVQIIENTDDTPRIIGENTDAYIRRILDKARQKGKDAAERGTRIHAVIEDWFDKRHLIRQASEQKILDSVLAMLTEVGGDHESWTSESSIVVHDPKFAGKCDKSHDKAQIVLDYKSKEFDDPAQVKAYPEQAMQLGAYALGKGYENPRLINVFVSVTQPGLLKVVEHEDPRRWMDAFLHLARYWHAIKGVD